MKPEQVNALISVIGLMTQTGGALLLVVLFSALRRSHPRPRPYFRQWTHGWAVLLVALSGVGAQYVLARQMTEWPPLRAGANFVYQAGKLLFVGFLLAGTLNFVGGVRPRVVLRWVLPVALLYSLLSVVLSGPVLNGVMVLQSPLIVGAFLYCAWVLLRLPASRTTLGSRITGSVFAAIALLWIAYAVAFALQRFPVPAVTGRTFDFLLYNSYFDLLLQVLLGYGMVVLLLEESGRENADARAQLALAHDRLKQLSFVDPLTGALNRRAYEEGAGLEALGARFGTAVILDMDNLKVVNDSRGHAAGDELLRQLVATLRGCVRPLDRIYRWGGDEFLLLFPGARPEEVVPRVREALHNVETLEASLGAALFSGTEELRAAIEQADRAMYEEKGRRARGASLSPAFTPTVTP